MGWSDPGLLRQDHFRLFLISAPPIRAFRPAGVREKMKFVRRFRCVLSQERFDVDVP